MRDIARRVTVQGKRPAASCVTAVDGMKLFQRVGATERQSDLVGVALQESLLLIVMQLPDNNCGAQRVDNSSAILL